MSENFESTFGTTVSSSEKHSKHYYDYDRNDLNRSNPFYSNPRQDFWEDDGYSLTGNPYASPDTINFSSNIVGSGLLGGLSDDHITFNPPSKFTMSETKNHLWKYSEDKILKDIEDYVTGTYTSHYCGHQQEYQGVQTIDLMAAKELASDFCQANILKYGSRYGDKDGRSKRDLLKVIHYAMLLLHFDGHYSRKDNGLSEFR